MYFQDILQTAAPVFMFLLLCAWTYTLLRPAPAGVERGFTTVVGSITGFLIGLAVLVGTLNHPREILQMLLPFMMVP